MSLKRTRRNSAAAQNTSAWTEAPETASTAKASAAAIRVAAVAASGCRAQSRAGREISGVALALREAERLLPCPAIVAS